MKPGILVALLCACIIAGAAARAKEEPCPIKIEWKRISDLPQAVGGPAFGALGGKLIAAGGTYWTGDEQKIWSADAYAYNPARGVWETITPLPEKAGYPCALSFGEALYVFGGQSAKETNNQGTWKLSRAGDSFKWEAFTNLPEKLANMQAAMIGSTAYLVAGDSGEPVPAPDNKVWKINLAAKNPKWETCVPLPGPKRTGVSVTASGGKLYAFGGGVSEAYRYDPKTNQWESIRALPYPSQWAWAASYKERYIILPGGFVSKENLQAVKPGTRIDENGFISEVLVYDTKTGKYFFSDPLPKGIIDYGLARIGNRLYLAGGEDRGKHRESWFFKGVLSPNN